MAAVNLNATEKAQLDVVETVLEDAFGYGIDYAASQINAPINDYTEPKFAKYRTPMKASFRAVAAGVIRALVAYVDAAVAGGGGGGGGSGLTVAAVSANATAAANSVVLVNSAGGNIAITLPNAPTNGSVVIVKKTSSDGNTISVTPSGGNTIDGSATIQYTAQYTALHVVAYSNNWYIV